MDLQKLKEILVEAKIFKEERSKNFVCMCPHCGDHPNPRKKGHLYVSKNPKVPVAHCFFCNNAWPIPKLIQDLTGDKELSKLVITNEELEKYQKQSKTYSSKTRYVQYKLPVIDENSFPFKRTYLQKRSLNKIDVDKLPGLVFNFLEFFKSNNLDIVGEGKQLSNFEAEMLQRNFVGFLGVHNTIMFCRNMDPNSKFKFKKIGLQNDSISLLDYWAIEYEDPTRTHIVLSEGNFDIIGEYSSDSLNIKNKVKVYASGNSFSYSSLLKSVCFDHDIYKADVIILSDDDKNNYHYYKFLKENSHIINTCQIYINKSGKDFGIFPQKPSKIL